ncbi:MAG: energy transducer TonB [Kofleriaceae bacterium]|nr:energy transducer TonB [Kofleriaceae bacterium]
MRLGSSSLELSIAGTLAVHLIIVVLTDVVRVYNPPAPAEPAPRIEMFEIEVPPVLAEPPPPVKQDEPKPEPEPVKPEPVPVKAVVVKTAVRATPARTVAPTEPVVDPTPPPPAAPGGDQVVTLDSTPPGATGVAVAVGRRTSIRVGRGGAGGGPGSGVGSGAGNDPPAPVSVATIKKRAMPKGDQSYFDAGKEYPAEARQLGIEGAIRVRLVVDAQGTVTSAVLLNKLGHGLDELAMRRAKQLQFEPAIDTNDRAVSSVVVWTFNMTLPK